MATVKPEDLLKVKSDALAAGKGYVFIGTAADSTGAGASPAPSYLQLRKAVEGDANPVPFDLDEAWSSIGNTSLENGIELANEGDEPEVLGSWQNPAIKTTTPAKKFSLTIALNDFTTKTFQLYYGSKKPADANGNFIIPVTPEPQEHSLLIVAVDGGEYICFYYPKVSIIGSDSITLDPSALSEIPVKANILGTGIDADGMGRISAKKNFIGADDTLEGGSFF
ncbi:hypothetical protein ACFYYS_06190 [Streptomyces sp. NPDC002120]|uniref:phage tail tube protein n=1 Tax=Streptomyces sp. NPDC002120 TaxID=3364631 RepID=UPI0036C3F5F8